MTILCKNNRKGIFACNTVVFTALAIVFILLCNAGNGFAQTVIFQSGFEVADPAFTASMTTGSSTQPTASNPNTGTYSGRMYHTSNNTSFNGSIITASTIPFVAGKYYTINVYAKIACAASTLKIAKNSIATNAAMAASTGGDQLLWPGSANVTLTTYSKKTVTFLATVTENKYVGFQVVSGAAGGCASNIYLDDIVITEYTDPPPAYYCTPTGNLNCTVNDYISNVQIITTTLNNTTACGAGGYTAYSPTGSQTGTVSPNQSYTFSLSVGAGTGTHGAGVWIDFDHSGTYDVGEFTLISNSIAPSSTTTQTIAIPAGAALGLTCMRVRYAYNLTVTSGMACSTGAGTYGETEDYQITICSPPSITGQPTSPAAVCAGTGTPSFTVTASGTGLTYQWQEYISSWNNVSNGGVYSGTTSTTLTITNPSSSMSGYKYRCVVTGACGSATSDELATLTVNPTTSISVQPSNTISCSGSGTPQFTVTVLGVGLSYQWQEYISSWNNISNGGVYSGATSATLTITNPPIGMNSYKYRCMVNGTCGNVTSDGLATLTVTAPSTISVHPNSQTVCQNTNVNFSVTASSGPYQWQVSTDNGSTWANITAAGSSPAYSNWTTGTLNLTGTDNPSGYQYRCVVGCNLLPSNAAILTIIPPSDPTPTGASSCTSPVSLVLSTSGAIAGEQYKWYDALSGGNLLYTSADNTVNTWATPSIAVTTTYYVTIFRTAGGCESSPRTPVVATINTPVSISIHPGNQIICTGDAANFSVTATGTGLTYQWRRNGVNLSNGGTISGVTTASLAINPADPINDGTIDVVIIGTCNTVTSNTAVLDVDPTQANAGIDQLVITTSTTLAGNSPVTGTGTWTRISGPNTPNIVNANLYNTQIGTTTGMIIGTYVYRWTIVLGGCTNYDEVVITNYCIGTYTNNCGYAIDITNVAVSDINNSSACYDVGTTNYTNFTNIVGSIQAGVNYPITITNGGGANNMWWGIWVDWNKDGDFLDATEFMAPINAATGISSNTGSLVVPAGTPQGNYYMRIRAKETSAMTQATVCGLYAYGEQEDYSLRVVPATCFNLAQDGGETSIDCGGNCFTPFAGAISGGGSYSCGSSVTLQTSSLGAIQWQYSSTGSPPWYDVAGAVTSIYSPTLTNTLSFRVEVSGGNCSPVYSSTATVTITGSVTNTWLTTGTTSWTTGTNWSLGVAPIACHNVVIPAGGNQPTVAPAGNIECNNITVNAGAILTLNYNTAKTFQIWGNIVNNGTINSINSGKWTLRGVLTTWGGTGTYTGTMYMLIGDLANVTLTNNVNVYSVEMTAVAPYGKLSLGSNTLTITNSVNQDNSSIYVNTGVLDIAITNTMILSLSSLYPEYGTVIFRGAANFIISGYWDNVGGTGFYNVEFAPPVGFTYIMSGNQLARNNFRINGADVRFQNYLGPPAADPAPPYTIKVAGNFINDGGFTTTADFTFIMNGSAAQYITGVNASTFNKLTINNTSGAGAGLGVTQVQPVTVTNIFSLLNGAFNLNSLTTTVTNAATTAITRTNGYIVSELNAANNTSKLQWNIGATLGAHLFPFGTTAGSYIPVTFNNSGNVGNVTISTRHTGNDNMPRAAASNVSVCSNMLGVGDSLSSAIDRWWDITSSVGSPLPAVNLTLSYLGSENTMTLVADRTTELGVQHWTGSFWNDGKGGVSSSVSLSGTNGVTTGVSSITVTGLTEFSPYVIVKGSKPLPVVLLNFSAICQNNFIQCKWATASEQNNDYFVLERSFDAMHWENVATVKGAGNSNEIKNYEYFDKVLNAGVVYYRLIQHDYDGKEITYNTIAVSCNTKANYCDIVLFPNPAHNVINLAISSDEPDEGRVYIYNAMGICVYTNEINITSETTKVKIDLTRFLNGSYYVKCVFDKHNPSEFKFVHLDK